MIPGMNSHQAKQMMRRMGISQVDIDATEVIIRTPEKDIIITNPQVAKVNMMGQQTFQIVGTISEQPRIVEKLEINEDDIKTVMDQTGASEVDAKTAIEEANGDLAKAIMTLKSSS
jgi:nascent polypeptide-associated complex subunit alpha